MDDVIHNFIFHYGTSSRGFKILCGGACPNLIIVIAVISHGTTPTAAPQTQTANTSIATSTPSIATTTAPTAASTNDLVGTWGSAVAGKGVQGSGKVTISGTSYQISLDGDVNLIIQKVANGAAVGTIAYNNLCLTAVVSAPGKTPVTKPAQARKSLPQYLLQSRSISLTLTFTGKSQLGSDISFTGTIGNGTITGTFTRMSSYGGKLAARSISSVSNKKGKILRHIVSSENAPLFVVCVHVR